MKGINFCSGERGKKEGGLSGSARFGSCRAHDGAACRFDIYLRLHLFDTTYLFICDH